MRQPNLHTLDFTQVRDLTRSTQDLTRSTENLRDLTRSSDMT